MVHLPIAVPVCMLLHSVKIVKGDSIGFLGHSHEKIGPSKLKEGKFRGAICPSSSEVTTAEVEDWTLACPLRSVCFLTNLITFRDPPLVTPPTNRHGLKLHSQCRLVVLGLEPLSSLHLLPSWPLLLTPLTASTKFLWQTLSCQVPDAHQPQPPALACSKQWA